MEQPASAPPQASIARLRAALTTGELTAPELLEHYLERIERHRELNAIVVLNPDARAEAERALDRYRAGTARPLEGIPFTVKDSYLAAGLTAANGSPAFAELRASHDAFTLATLRAAGAILIGKTNMPPMADGGMQRGVYGRSESPFDRGYLPAAYASGSSHGSAVAVAADLCQFGMGEETVSSGRSPASNNGICAYTPSRGVLSIRGNWPLFPTRDVVVPHTKTVDDMLELLNVLVVDDPIAQGDFWRAQHAVRLPAASATRPADYREISSEGSLARVRLAAPRRYLGADPDYPLEVHPDVIELWHRTRALLEQAGATVIETGFPLIEAYEGRSEGKERLDELGGLPEGWMDHEYTTLVAAAWDDFLRENADPRLNRLSQVDPARIFPLPPGQLPDRYPEVGDNVYRYGAIMEIAGSLPDPLDSDGPRIDVSGIPGFAQALQRLEALRRELLESWMEREGFDAVVLPANADVARADADTDPGSAEHAWRDGIFYSNGNLAFRHLGIPSVTTSMGTMPSTGMPVGVTFIGAAYSDPALLGYAREFERLRGPRPVPGF